MPAEHCHRAAGLWAGDTASAGRRAGVKPPLESLSGDLVMAQEVKLRGHVATAIAKRSTARAGKATNIKRCHDTAAGGRSAGAAIVVRTDIGMTQAVWWCERSGAGAVRNAGCNCHMQGRDPRGVRISA